MAFVIIQITNLSLKIKDVQFQSKILITTYFKLYLRKSIYKLILHGTHRVKFFRGNLIKFFKAIRCLF